MPPMATGMAANVILTLQRDLAAAHARIAELEELCRHLRYCRECSETDVEKCHEGRTLWNKALTGEQRNG